MKFFIPLLILIPFHMTAQNMNCNLVLPNSNEVKLDQKDLFIITEFREIEYQSFIDADSLNLPANLSSENYFVDINNQTDSSNIVDINYLYLHGYHVPNTNYGQLFYLLSTKHVPYRLTRENVLSSKTIDLYSELSSIVDMSFGYWVLDPTTNRIFIIFRDHTKIRNMENFRIFSGLIINENIYLTNAMNTKDSYLFSTKFKHRKEIFVKLPIPLENVLYSKLLKTEDPAKINLAKLTKAQGLELKNNSKQRTIQAVKKYEIIDSIKQNDKSSHKAILSDAQRITVDALVKERYNENPEPKKEEEQPEPVKTDVKKDQPRNDTTKNKNFKATIKFAYYPTSKESFDKRKIEYLDYDSLSFAFTKRRNGKTGSKFILLKGQRKKLGTYSRIKVKQYKNYYSSKNMTEFVFIHIIDPYDETNVSTITIPFSSGNWLINFIRKKIFNAK